MLMRVVLAGALMAGSGLRAQMPGGEPWPPGPRFPIDTGRFLGAEPGMPVRVVRGAPYSADVVSESVQTLADGNHIRQTSTARVFRDSEGRTRREQSLRGLGGLLPNAQLRPLVFINDPGARVNYSINSRNRTATRFAWEPRRENPSRPAQPPEPRQRREVKTESLGRQIMEGMQVEGTRTTVTIPAGEIGNDLPIQVIHETWRSPELSTVVLSKSSDPRFGETVYRLTNISRAEPDRSLFEVPADFKVTDVPRSQRE